MSKSKPKTLKERRREYAQMMRVRRGEQKPKGPRKLRHGARNANEEYIRDRELRELIKQIDKSTLRRGSRSWPDQDWRAYETTRSKVRAAARAELRQRWAQEDAARTAEENARADAYARAGIVRLVPGQKITGALDLKPNQSKAATGDEPAPMNMTIDTDAVGSSTAPAL